MNVFTQTYNLICYEATGFTQVTNNRQALQE